MGKYFVIILILILSASINAQVVDTLWTRAFNGPACDEDYVVDLEIDNQNNLYVVGFQFPNLINLVKYTPNGNIDWIGNYYGASTASTIDSNYIYITGHTGGTSGGGPPFNMITHKINLLSSDTVWTRIFAGPLDNDQAWDIYVDSTGNVYITGNSESIDSDYDFFTIKYNPDGDTLWTRRYSSDGIMEDYARHIQVDKSGNVIISGNTGIFNQNSVIVKYDKDGNTVWISQFNPPGTSSTKNYIALDNDDNIIMTGHITGYNFSTIKYYPNGDTAWIHNYLSPILGDGVNIVKTDLRNNIILGGTRSVIKYDSSGNMLWQTEGKGQTLCLEDTTFIYASGNESMNNTSETIKLTSDGDTVWILPFTNDFHDTREALELKLDSDKNLIKIGNTFITTCASTTDYMTVKYFQDLCCKGIRGNIDSDTLNVIDISDLVYLVDFMFTSGTAPQCPEEANVDGDIENIVDISDLVALVDFMFTSGQAPADCPY